MPLYGIATALATQYATINLSALKKTPLYAEFDEIATGTDGFTDEEMCAIYADNFRVAYEQLQQRYPDALKAKKQAQPKSVAVPVKKALTASQRKRVAKTKRAATTAKKAKANRKTKNKDFAQRMAVARAKKKISVPAPVPASAPPASKGKKGKATPKPANTAKSAKTINLTPTDEQYLAARTKVKVMPRELVHVKKYASLATSATKEKVVDALAALQRDIRRGVLHKTSPNAELIMAVQQEYVTLLKGKAPYKPAKHLPGVTKLVAGTRVYKSVDIMLAVAGWNEADKTAAQCKKLLATIRNAKLKGKIEATDPFAAEVDKLEAMLAAATGGKHFTASHVDLSGLQGLAGLPPVPRGWAVGDGVSVRLGGKRAIRTIRACKGNQCDIRAKVGDKPQWVSHSKLTRIGIKTTKRAKRLALSGIGDIPAMAPAPVAAPASSAIPTVASVPAVMTAAQMMQLDYKTYAFKGDWLALLGQPATNFKLMVWGEPGMGKSTLVMRLARYLAADFGPVLYCSSEEYPSYTLNEKVTFVGGPVPGWEFAKSPVQLTARHKFLVLDSLNHFGWTNVELKALAEKRPDLAIILINQATKEGKFKGNQDIAHEVDVVIHAYAPGKAQTTKNRFAKLSDIQSF